ncbi:MAG: transporter substrate-binding domain-containing protein [Ferrovibrio sp.]|uniref:substrate-binding periplasmic protein n=1 Tax=Ferrovibrio sp. TaxID=1917215 RepID=UPI00263809B7|nr:transporter substrate-binding domain-containing protein [Ferrovibrio sp.]MCW0235545.1 transporter substrate-binding domain-containing protein [Ferrovibrio sp.]
MPRFACFAVLPAACLVIAAWLTTAPAHGADLPVLHYVAGRFPPYTQEDANSIAIGPTAALVAELARRLGRPAPLLVQPFARALATAEHEPNTLIALIARTPEREESFHWVCPVLDYDVLMFRRRERSLVVANAIADLKQWRIAGVNRDVKTEYLLRHGIPVEIMADEDEATRLLLFGRVDAMPGHPATVRMRLREQDQREDALVPMLALPELTSKLYLAFGRSTAPEVAATVAQTCAAMIASGEVAQLLQPVMQN